MKIDGIVVLLKLISFTKSVLINLDLPAKKKQQLKKKFNYWIS